jgi:hypothetical protein
VRRSLQGKCDLEKQQDWVNWEENKGKIADLTKVGNTIVLTDDGGKYTIILGSKMETPALNNHVFRVLLHSGSGFVNFVFSIGKILFFFVPACH